MIHCAIGTGVYEGMRRIAVVSGLKARYDCDVPTRTSR